MGTRPLPSDQYGEASSEAPSKTVRGSAWLSVDQVGSGPCSGECSERRGHGVPPGPSGPPSLGPAGDLGDLGNTPPHCPGLGAVCLSSLPRTQQPVPPFGWLEGLHWVLGPWLPQQWQLAGTQTRPWWMASADLPLQPAWALAGRPDWEMDKGSRTANWPPQGPFLFSWTWTSEGEVIGLKREGRENLEVKEIKQERMKGNMEEMSKNKWTKFKPAETNECKGTCPFSMSY